VAADGLEVTVAEARELAATWVRDLERIAGDMYAHLAERIPEASADRQIAALTLASCSSNVEALLSMIRHGIPASATEAPVAALEHARQMAVRGSGVDATLRFYRLGHAWLWERWSDALGEVVSDREALVVALHESSAFVFHYIDTVSARVSAEHVAERERLQRRAAAVRADVVRALLAGEALDHAEAERALGHPLDASHLAFVCWTEGDPQGLELAAAAVARAVGATRPLLLPEGPQALAGWAVAHAEPDPAALGRAVAAAAPEVLVAVGPVARGVAGFRASRDGAQRARRVAELTGRQAPWVTRHADVALVDLLSRDLPAARALVASELGALAARDPASQRLRATLLAVVAPQGGIASAAQALGVHRNTVLQRMRRAEELRGASALVRPAELHAALVLAEALPDAVL
jgi:DNA-binding PucR family transcriptional regulator